MSHAQQKPRGTKENNSEVGEERSMPLVLGKMMFLSNQEETGKSRKLERKEPNKRKTQWPTLKVERSV